MEPYDVIVNQPVVIDNVSLIKMRKNIEIIDDLLREGFFFLHKF